MKKLLFTTILLFFVNGIISAQERHNPNLRTYCEFAPDTIAYLKTNFEFSQGSFYTKRPMSDLFEDLEIPIETVEIIFSSYTNDFSFINLYFRKSGDLESDSYGFVTAPIHIRLMRAFILPEPERYHKLHSGDIVTFYTAFTDEIRQLLSPLVIATVSYVEP